MANTDNFDPKSVKKLSAMEIIKRVGPGIIMTGIVIGPGNITTSAMLGANYGYDMMWIIIPIILMAIIFMLVSYRISMLTGMPLLHAIRHYYGNAAAAFCGVCLFLTCFFFTMGNVSGTGAGMHLIFGIDWKIGAAIMLVILIIVYFAKNVYSKIEIGITICIIAMIAAFYITLVGVGGPDWGKLELSPMMCNVLVKPLPRENISRVLYEGRCYLQTAGLICPPDLRSSLTDLFIRCGLIRVTSPSDMSAYFPGESHDGEYALDRYTRVINIQEDVL